MSFYPYTLLDYTRGFGPFPLVTQGFYHSPTYSAKATDKGGDVFLDGTHIASFDAMEEACVFVTEQGSRALPWFMRDAPETKPVDPYALGGGK